MSNVPEKPSRPNALSNDTAVVVTTDFSANAQRAFPQAVRLAKSLDAPIELVHVLRPEEHTSSQLASAAMRLNGLAQRLLQEHEVPFAAHLLVGDPVAQIIRHAQALSATALIVIASEGSSEKLQHAGQQRRFLGSTTAALTAASPVPVVVIPRPSEGNPHNTTAAKAAWRTA